MQAGTQGTAVQSEGPDRVKRSYGRRLADAVAAYGPLCVGIDPHPSILESWGLPTTVAGLETCARRMVEASAGLVASVKPQSAFYEAYGSAGIAVLERVLADCREAGLLSLLDVKRGDIGSTMGAYAAAYLADDAPLAADAITVSPYLGVGSLTGAVELAHRTGRGVYLLAATSNPEAGEFQRAVLPASGQHDGPVPTVAQAVVEAATSWNVEQGVTPGTSDWGSLGLVIGATIDAEMVGALDLSRVCGPILAPGVGAQGGGADDLGRVFGEARRYVLAASSRAVMAAGPDLGDLRTAIGQQQRTLG